jgi:phosphatidylglycerophosphate synthase
VLFRSFGSTAYITPKTFPYGVSIVSLICGLEILISGFLAWKKEKHSQIKASPITLHFVAFLIFALGILFSGALKTIGYPIVNTLSILAMYYISGGKKIWVGVITAVSFSVVSYLFFSVYLKLSIPLGLGL